MRNHKTWYDKEKLLIFFHHLADISGDVIRKYFRSSEKINSKKDGSLVTMVDQQVEYIIRKEIKKKFPLHNIIGEEEKNDLSFSSEYTWVIDPIDGTSSFAIGMPIFTTMIAFLLKDKVKISMINQPITKERWVGIDQENSYLNKKIIFSRKNSKNLSESIIAATSPDIFSYQQKKAFDKISSICKYRLYGGDSYLYALLASGNLDIVMEANLKKYDFLPLIPLVNSAKGIITDWNGKNLNINSKGEVLACASKNLHTQIINLLNKS